VRRVECVGDWWGWGKGSADDGGGILASWRC
jgi:hypothetical protein